jgi:hypothetical protein
MKGTSKRQDMSDCVFDLALIIKLLQTYDSTFVFVFICIKGNIGGGGAATVQ